MDWNRLSFPEQLGNIGAEISRARFWDEKGNLASRDRSLERTLDLVHATLDGNRAHLSRLREVSRLGEVVAGVYAGTDQDASSLKLLEEFCMHFAILARCHDRK